MPHTVQRPEPSSRHPLVLFLLAVCAITGLTILFGGPAPQSVQRQLEPLTIYFWAVSLLAGAAAVLVALAMQAGRTRKRVVDGILIEQIGVACLGFAAMIYSAAVFATVGWAGFLPAGITLTFGAACLYRWISIQQQLNPSGWVARIAGWVMHPSRARRTKRV